jgi:Sulfotransferase family
VTPVLLSGFGRSGTTAIMALLGTDSRVAFDRIYPFEIRYLTYLIKQSLLAGRQHPGTVHDAFAMCEVNRESGSAPPWHPLAGTLLQLSDVLSPKELWTRLAKQLQAAAPAASHYAEKAPFWLADQLRGVTPVHVIHLVRDPRDVYLSVRAFAQSMGQIESHKLEGDFDTEHARDMAYQLVSFAEAERSDRGRDDAKLVRYEDWATDSHGVAARMGNWLGLDFDPDSPDLTSHLGKHRTTKDVAASKGRWHREPLPDVVGKLLLPAIGSYGADYGYDLPAPQPDIVPDPRRPHSTDADLQMTAAGSRMTLRGGDAWIELLDKPVAAADVTEVWVCLRANVGEINSLYWCRADENYDEARVIHAPFYRGHHVQIVRLIVKNHPQWTGAIHKLRVDICNGAVTPGDAVDVHWVRLVR